MFATADSTSHFLPLPCPEASQRALSWIMKEPPATTVAEGTVTASPPSWYLGGREISSWCTDMCMGLSGETRIFLLRKIEWVIQATLSNLERLRAETPKKWDEIRVIAVKYSSKTHNLFLFQNTIFFSLPATSSGTFKTAIPMVDLQTGTLLMRLRVKQRRDFEPFLQEQALHSLFAGPSFLPIVGSVIYQAKGFPHAIKHQAHVDPRHRHSILTPAYSYNLYSLCPLNVFSEFTKLFIALESAKALAQIHSLGHLHNDLKTKNILLDADKGLVVADYGHSSPVNSMQKDLYLAKIKASLEDGSFVLPKSRNNLTTSYISAPELPKTHYTLASDVFTYGMVLLELCGKGSLFPLSLYDTDKFYNSRVSELVYNQRLEELLGKRCLIDCLENIARDALSYRAEDRPSMTIIIDRLTSLSSHFPKSQEPLLPQFENFSLFSKLAFFHNDDLIRSLQASKPHFSNFKHSFSLWIDGVLTESSLLAEAQTQYLIKTKRVFEELTHFGNKYLELHKLCQKPTLPVSYVEIATDSGEFLGRVLVVKSHLLYGSAPIIENCDVSVRNTYDIETGQRTDLIIVGAKSVTISETMKLQSQLPSIIRNHPALTPILGLITYESKKNSHSSFLESRERALEDPSGIKTSEKTNMICRRCPYSYKRALDSDKILTPVNLLEWSKNLTHFLCILHEEGLLLGRFYLKELGLNEKEQLVIKHLNGLVKKNALLEWQHHHTSESPLPAQYKSLFSDFVSEKNDVRNLAMILFIFAKQALHLKFDESDNDYKKDASTLFSISDQAQLDHYLDYSLLPKGADDDLYNVLRDMLRINPEDRISSQQAYDRILALNLKTLV